MYTYIEDSLWLDVCLVEIRDVLKWVVFDVGDIYIRRIHGLTNNSAINMQSIQLQLR